MKQKDLVLIAMVVVISGFMSFFLGRFLFDSPKNRSIQAEYVDPISEEFNVNLSKKYFNAGSINPTQIIQIGENANETPFSGGR